MVQWLGLHALTAAWCLTSVVPWSIFGHGQLKKYSQPRSWELCFMQWEFLGLHIIPKSNLERTALRRWVEEPCYVVLRKRAGSLNSRLLLIKENEIFQVKELLLSLSHVQLFASSWTAALQASLFTISWSLLRFMSVESVMLSSHHILFLSCCPLLFLPSIFPRIRVFSNESTPRIKWPKYWRVS